MSQSGQLRPKSDVRDKSASPLIATISRTSREVSSGANRLMRRSKGALFDHLVGQQLHRFGDRETKGLSRFHVDHKFNLGRLLDRQIGRLGAAH
jgi:hypothetical protein